MGGLGDSGLGPGDPCCGGAEGTRLSAADPDNDTNLAACVLLAADYENDWSRNGGPNDTDGPNTDILQVQGAPGKTADLNRSIYHLDPNSQHALNDPDGSGRPTLGACGDMVAGTTHQTNYLNAPVNVVPAFTEVGTCDGTNIETLIQLQPLNVPAADVDDWSWSGGAGWNGCVSRFEGGCMAYNKPSLDGLPLGIMVADLGCPFTHPVCCQCCSGSEGQEGTLHAKCVKDNNQIPSSNAPALGILHATAATPTSQGEITLPYYDAANAAAAGFPNQIAEFYMDSMRADGTCGQTCGAPIPSVLLPRNARCISHEPTITTSTSPTGPTEEPGACWGAGRRTLLSMFDDMEDVDVGDFSEMETITTADVALELGNEKSPYGNG